MATKLVNRNSTPSVIDKRSLVDVIADDTRKGILSGRFALGQRLVETDLMKELGVSRGPLREAFRRLSAEGVVQLIPNKGAVVSRLTRHEVTNRYQIRIALESLAAMLAASRPLSPAERDRLTLALQACRDHPGTGINQGQPDANYELHGVITELSGNPELAVMIGRLWLPSQMVLGMRGVLDGSYWPVSNAEHEVVVEAILAGKRQAAGKAMRVHLQSGCDRILALPGYVFGE